MKNKELGIAKKDLKPGDEIKIFVLKDGRLFSKEINCFDSVTIKDFLELRKPNIILFEREKEE